LSRISTRGIIGRQKHIFGYLSGELLAMLYNYLLDQDSLAKLHVCSAMDISQQGWPIGNFTSGMITVGQFAFPKFPVIGQLTNSFM